MVCLTRFIHLPPDKDGDTIQRGKHGKTSLGEGRFFISPFFSSRRKEGKRIFSYWFEQILQKANKEDFSSLFLFRPFFSSRRKVGKRSFSYWFEQILQKANREDFSSLFLFRPFFSSRRKVDKRIFSYWFEQVLYSHKEGAVFRSFLIFPVPADTKARAKHNNSSRSAPFLFTFLSSLFTKKATPKGGFCFMLRMRIPLSQRDTLHTVHH